MNQFDACHRVVPASSRRWRLYLFYAKLFHYEWSLYAVRSILSLTEVPLGLNQRTKAPQGAIGTGKWGLPRLVLLRALADV